MLRATLLPTRWTSTLSSKVNLQHAINFRVSCGANLVTYPTKFWGGETLELHRVDVRDGIGLLGIPQDTCTQFSLSLSLSFFLSLYLSLATKESANRDAETARRGHARRANDYNRLRALRGTTCYEPFDNDNRLRALRERPRGSPVTKQIISQIRIGI